MRNYEYLKQLAKDRKTKVENLLALSPKNDPFYAGKPADWKAAEWFTAIFERMNLTGPAHLRRVHYWIVSQREAIFAPGLKESYANTIPCWQYLTQAAKMARYLGLVELTDIIDNKNPAPIIHANYADRDTLEYYLDLPDLDAPMVRLTGPYIANAQPYHLEVWCEKGTMNDVLLPVCQQFNINLVTFQGEASITACRSLLTRMEEADKPVRVFYISDFDPAGKSMPVAVSRKVEWIIANEHFDVDFRLKPLALSEVQVEQRNLPRIPIKPTEKRAGRFEEAYGEGACELDAMEAIYPGELAQLATTEIGRYYDPSAARYAIGQARTVRIRVEEARDAIMDEYRDEIEALREMYDRLKEIEVEVDDCRITAQEPHVEEEDEDWLFNSERSYVDQIMAYKEHKGRLGIRVEEED